MRNTLNHTPNHAPNTTLNGTLPQSTYPQLRDLRNALMALHRVLLNTERLNYEQVRGWTANADLLQLVIHHPQFAWLHQLSQLIVQMDEVWRSDEPVAPEAVQALLDEARSLLTPSEMGSAFAKRYYTALQRDPAAVLAHAEVAQLLAQDHKSDSDKSGLDKSGKDV